MPERPFVLGLSGSPRPRANTEHLLATALEAAAAAGAITKLVRVTPLLAGLKLPFCTHCSSVCQGRCYLDTELEKSLSELGRADGLLVASPVYFGTVSAELKAYWDFTRRLRTAQALVDVPGAAISVAQCRFGGQETTIRAIHDMMLIHGMVIAGDTVYGLSHGQHGAAAQEPAAGDPGGMERAAVTGRHVAELATALLPYRRARLGVPPAAEPPTS
jgi:multimeric flavodoxin WrbA